MNTLGNIFRKQFLKNCVQIPADENFAIFIETQKNATKNLCLLFPFISLSNNSLNLPARCQKIRSELKILRMKG